MPNRPPDDEPQPRSSLDDESADTTPESGTDEPERGLSDLAQRSDDDSDALDLGILEPRPTDAAPDSDESPADSNPAYDNAADERDELGSRSDDADEESDIDDDPPGAPSGPTPPDPGDGADPSGADGESSGSDAGEFTPDDASDDANSEEDPADDAPTDDDDDDGSDDELSAGDSEVERSDDEDDDVDDDEGFEDDGSSPLLKAGPRWYRSQIRRFGPVAALVPMAGFGLIAWLALTLFDSRASGIVGLVAGAAAAPGLLVAGAPFGDSDYYPFVVMASIPFWLALGWLAARRATRRPVMSWRDYVRELVWLALAVLVGVIVALSIASAQLGEPLLS